MTSRVVDEFDRPTVGPVTIILTKPTWVCITPDVDRVHEYFWEKLAPRSALEGTLVYSKVGRRLVKLIIREGKMAKEIFDARTWYVATPLELLGRAVYE